jgi:hypothetical protein
VRPGRLTVVPRRRSPWPAVAAGVVVGLLGAGVMVAGRFGVFDPWLEQWAHGASPTVDTTMARATSAVSVRLRIQTTPVGADVFEVLPSGIRLIGLTPLTVPWEVAVGDPGRQFQLKKKGYVTSRARVDPPSPSADGKPVQLDIDATLRPVPAP